MAIDLRLAPPGPLRVGFYSPELPERGLANGIVTYTRIMRDALRSLGHSVTIVTPRLMENFDGSVVPLPKTSRLVRRGRYMLEKLRPASGANPWVTLQVLDAFEAAREAGVDIFEIEESFGWAGRVSNRGVPIVERLHGPHAFVRDRVETPEKRKLGDLREAAELDSFTRVQAITSPTQRLLDAVCDRFEVQPHLCRAIPNPIQVAPPGQTWSRDEANPEQILFVGRFDACKGADVILRAFTRALDERPTLSLIMVGPDEGLPRADGSTLRYEDFVSREVPPEVRNRIRFLGMQPATTISELRFQSAVAVVASRFETFSYAIAEAMSVGMPIITTGTFGGTEMISDGVEGRVTPVGDVARLSTAIVEMTANSARAAEMGRAGYLRASDWLSPGRIAQVTVDLYGEVIGAR